MRLLFLFMVAAASLALPTATAGPIFGDLPPFEDTDVFMPPVPLPPLPPIVNVPSISDVCKAATVGGTDACGGTLCDPFRGGYVGLYKIYDGDAASDKFGIAVGIGFVTMLPGSVTVAFSTSGGC